MNEKRSGAKGFFRFTKEKVVLTIFILFIFLLIAYLYNSSFRTIPGGIDPHPDPAYLLLLVFAFWPFAIALIVVSSTKINIGILLVLAIIIETIYICSFLHSDLGN